MGRLVLKEEEPRERNVVSHSLDFADVGEGHLCCFGRRVAFLGELVELVLNLEVNPSLTEVVVLQEHLTCA